MKITIVDYGMANLRSVQKAFEAVGAEAVITSDPKAIRHANKVVLPGVGAFRDAIAKLRETGLADAVCDHAAAGRPFLGICLGLQLLLERGFEDGTHQGLGLIRGDVIRFPSIPGLKVPHMGWNTLSLDKPDCPLFQGLPENAAFYFVHSYIAQPTDRSVIAAHSDYPGPFCAALWHNNIIATQFHPEKSQAMGRILLKNFAAMS